MLHWVDVAIIVGYVVGCTAIGAWVSAKTSGLRGYLLGESNIPAWAVMISIVATETSTATFLSVPGIAYKGNFTFLQLPMGYILARFVVAALLLPSYFRGEIFTAYQVLQRRFGGPTRTTASILFLATRVPADGLRLFLTAKTLQVLTDWGIEWSILAVGVATIVYTFLGGTKAVVWTDVIQFFIYLVGAIAALFILAGKVPGGWGALVDQAGAAGKFRVFDFGLDLDRPYTFWAGVIGGLVLSTSTHGADQLMVQRYLSARSARSAGAALIGSGFVVFAQFVLFLFIGVSLYVFYRQFPPEIAPGASFDDQEFSYFIVHYLPTGLIGLVIAAVFSAAMSTLSGSLNASAATAVNDLYRPVRPDAGEAHLVRLSRGLTVAWGLAQVGMALGAVAFGFRLNVVNGVLAISSFTTGIVLGLFLLGIYTRVGQAAALVGLIAGLSAVTSTWYFTPIAWPWYALVGSSTTFLVGLIVGQFLPHDDRAPADAALAA